MLIKIARIHKVSACQKRKKAYGFLKAISLGRLKRAGWRISETRETMVDLIYLGEGKVKRRAITKNKKGNLKHKAEKFMIQFWKLKEEQKRTSEALCLLVLKIWSKGNETLAAVKKVTERERESVFFFRFENESVF